VYEGVVQDLIDELGRLPGVGPKGAQRIAFHLLAADPVDVRRLAEVLLEVKAKARFCAWTFERDAEESLTDLGDLVVAAFRDAKAKADALAAQALGPLAGGLGGDLGGGLGGLGGLTGGSPGV
jgi:hypothetical protein